MTFRRPPPKPAKQMDGYTPKPRTPALSRADGQARMVVSVPKSEPVRSRDYLRWVASLPCISCGIEGRSQAAHGPTLGRGIKADDRTAVPLCADGPAAQGCHTRVDQYQMFSREDRAERMAAWAAEIQALWAERNQCDGTR